MRQSLTSVGLRSALHWWLVASKVIFPESRQLSCKHAFSFSLRSRYPSCTLNYYSLLRCGGTTSPSLNANAAIAAAVSCIRRSFGKRGEERREEEAAYDEPSFVSRRVANGVPATRVQCGTITRLYLPHEDSPEVQMQT